MRDKRYNERRHVNSQRRGLGNCSALPMALAFVFAVGINVAAYLPGDRAAAPEKGKHMSLYDSDFHAWAEEQATLLREQRFDLLDLENIVEEIESLGRSERRALESALQNALIHLLKLAYTEGPRDPENNWRRSVRNARKLVTRAMHEQPSLRAHLPELAQTAYAYATQDAHDELADHGDTHAPFPGACPWTIEQVLDTDFCPEC